MVRHSTGNVHKSTNKPSAASGLHLLLLEKAIIRKHRARRGRRKLNFGFINIEPSERNTAELDPLTHSLTRFTKGEKIPAGKVVRPHPVSSLINVTSSNGQEKAEDRWHQQTDRNATLS